ncbi:MAG TPA: hypothetical protein VF195_10195 [Actinomycetota bacterium]
MRRTIGLSIAGALLMIAGFVGPVEAAGVQRSTTGDGRQLTGAGVGFRTFAFAVVEHNDGRVTGEASVMNPVIGSDRVFEISCLTVIIGNDGSPIAIASGPVVAAEDPSLIGRNGIFAVQDLGEGHDPSDRMTLGVLLSPVRCADVTSEEALRSVFPRGLLAIDDGNIQVRA